MMTSPACLFEMMSRILTQRTQRFEGRKENFLIDAFAPFTSLRLCVKKSIRLYGYEFIQATV